MLSIALPTADGPIVNREKVKVVASYMSMWRVESIASKYLIVPWTAANLDAY
jgi:hypothetical protein